jgi:alkylation response protein AidB-like acyl-CoA dehydrogenase
MLQHAAASTDASPVSDFGGLSAQWRPLRDKVERFIEERIYPLERSVDDVDNDAYLAVMRPLMDEAKAAGIWALGHPREIGGHGMPTDAPGYRIVREIPVLGMRGCHCEVELEDVRVPASNLVGGRGEGFKIAQRRLGPGRIYHCMRWLGEAQRAFDLMCRRANERVAFGGPLAGKQLVQKMVFDSAADIQACRLLTLDAARKLDAGDDARTEIAVIKVVGAQMVHGVIDRAIQVHGALGVTIDTPLERMYRHARFARIYDGPDEVHIESVVRRILKTYAGGGEWDFAARDPIGSPALRVSP